MSMITSRLCAVRPAILDAASPSPLDAIDSGTPGEVKVSVDSMVALQHLYHTSPSIQAARQILMGQLLSSGVVVRRVSHASTCPASVAA